MLIRFVKKLAIYFKILYCYKLKEIYMKSCINFNNIVNAIEKDEKKTQYLISLIDNIKIEQTNINNGTVNILTILWKLLDEYYEQIIKCKNSDDLKKILHNKKIILIKNIGQNKPIYLDENNYVQIKSDINKFYSQLIEIAEVFNNSPLSIDKEELIKKIKLKQNGIYGLLLIDDFAVKLQNIVYLPKIQLNAAYETNRPSIDYKNEHLKILNNFIKFLSGNISDTDTTIIEYTSIFTKILKYAKRKKILILITLILIIGSTWNMHNKYFSSIFDTPKINYILENINYDINNKSLYFFVKNNQNQRIRVLKVNIERNNNIIGTKELDLEIKPYYTEKIFINNIEVLSGDIIKVIILSNDDKINVIKAIKQ